MKKLFVFVIVIAIAGGMIWRFNNSNVSIFESEIDPNATSTEKVPTSQTVMVSKKLSEYKNEELGFSVKYPTVWERGESATNVSFLILNDSMTEKHTLGNLQAKIDVVSSKCSFPPVTTITERDTITVGDKTFNMISIANTLQGRNYFTRMYSLQKDSICYFFTLSSITLSPTSKGYTGVDAQKVGAQNKTMVDTADAQFKDMVRSFEFVVGPAGQQETEVAPKKP